MAKQPGKNMNISVASVALEDDATSVSVDMTQATPDVTAFSDAGPRTVTDNYGWSTSMDGNADFASGQSDATIFAGIGSTGQALDYDPTGVAAGASNPHYTGTQVLTSYSIKSAVGAATTFSAKWTGNSALTRAVA